MGQLLEHLLDLVARIPAALSGVRRHRLNIVVDNPAVVTNAVQKAIKLTNKSRKGVPPKLTSIHCSLNTCFEEPTETDRQ
ncbi:2-succinyl-5-enolpyruvyl-6-hydroxy-3-cyclohexene-1-carboxylate synthase [Trichinella pseudospiralis]|uniref:Uncharacterized protein n=1 Tax=Trichinella pseudospiralis TaxID=6337 RepID=A0A0V1FVV2_TRIPS|nr:hypothetical protein T4D_14378 [Trichinella pseudospiralis]